MNENIYYKKKINLKGLILPIVSLVIIACIFYCLFYFTVNPSNTLEIINNGEIGPAYTRDYIFSLTPDVLSSDLPELQIIVNEDLNTDMSESLQHISLSSGDNLFEWDRFFKFDTSLTKTPYDTRYIRFDNYSEKYNHNYTKTESNLMFLLNEQLSKNSNILLDKNKYENKKLKVNLSGATINEKLKVNYEIKFDSAVATEIFNELYDSIWNSEEFLSFFKMDNDIQSKLGINNNTKSFIDIIYGIKENSVINNLRVGVIANKDYVESIAYEFDISYIYGNTKQNLKISIGEYLREYDDERSPEDTFEAMSVVNFNELSTHTNNTVGDDIEIPQNSGSFSSSTEK